MKTTLEIKILQKMKTTLEIKILQKMKTTLEIKILQKMKTTLEFAKNENHSGNKNSAKIKNTGGHSQHLLICSEHQKHEDLKMGKNNFKVINIRVIYGLLNQRVNFLRKNDWPKSKWIFFCEEMLKLGFIVKLYEARQTKLKYCIIVRDNDHRKFKVCFSDHKPIKRRELNEDCDFFVGMTHTGVRNTNDAINAVCKHFGVDRNKPFKNDKVKYITDFISDDPPWHE